MFLLLDLRVGMAGGHTELIFCKLQAWQTPLAALTGLLGLASVLYTEADHIDKSEGGPVAEELLADSGGKGGGGIQVSLQKGQGPQWGDMHGTRLLGPVCFSLLHPLEQW